MRPPCYYLLKEIVILGVIYRSLVWRVCNPAGHPWPEPCEASPSHLDETCRSAVGNAWRADVHDSNYTGSRSGGHANFGIAWGRSDVHDSNYTGSRSGGHANFGIDDIFRQPRRLFGPTTTIVYYYAMVSHTNSVKYWKCWSGGHANVGIGPLGKYQYCTTMGPSIYIPTVNPILTSGYWERSLLVPWPDPEPRQGVCTCCTPCYPQPPFWAWRGRQSPKINS